MSDVRWQIVENFNDLSALDVYRILGLRCEVFIVEQKCPFNDVVSDRSSETAPLPSLNFFKNRTVKIFTVHIYVVGKETSLLRE